MKFALVYSKENSAGKNIVEKIKTLAFTPQIPIIELKKEVLYTDITKDKFPALQSVDFIVFPSIHKSKDNKPALCVHAPGNWRNADYGGKEGKLCMSSAFVMKYLFQQLQKNAEGKKLDDYYQITLEATHHGPFCKLPCCFIEIGSTEKEYNDAQAIGSIAKTILSLQTYAPDENWISAIAIGGPHYAPNFNKLQLKSLYAIAHILPSYAMPLTENMLKEAEEKTKEQLNTVLVDWKGCGNAESRQKYIELIKKQKLEYRRA